MTKKEMNEGDEPRRAMTAAVGAVVAVVISTTPSWLLRNAAWHEKRGKQENGPGILVQDLSHCYSRQYRRVALYNDACQILFFFLHLQRKFIAAVDLISMFTQD